MLKTLKINENENEIAFIGCAHHNHNRSFIFSPRGFNSMEEHDSALIQRWNETCSNRTIVFSLGDEQFDDPTGDKLKNLFRRLNFKTLYMICGNHVSGRSAIYKEELKVQFPDVFHPNGHDFLEVYPLTYKVDKNPFKQVVFLPTYVEVVINGDRFVLCHYPIYSHHKQSHKSIHLSSHCHGNCKLTNKNTGKGLRLDVGIESFGRPITLAEVKSFMSKREPDITDHHGK